jgi:hypothetical protein
VRFSSFAHSRGQKGDVADNGDVIVSCLEELVVLRAFRMVVLCRVSVSQAWRITPLIVLPVHNLAALSTLANSVK